MLTMIESICGHQPTGFFMLETFPKLKTKSSKVTSPPMVNLCITYRRCAVEDQEECTCVCPVINVPPEARSSSPAEPDRGAELVPVCAPVCMLCLCVPMCVSVCVLCLCLCVYLCVLCVRLCVCPCMCTCVLVSVPMCTCCSCVCVCMCACVPVYPCVSPLCMRVCLPVCQCVLVCTCV